MNIFFTCLLISVSLSMDAFSLSLIYGTYGFSKKSERIFEKLENLKIWKEMELVYSYVSYNQEVQTAKRMEQWMATGKRIAVPKVVGEDIRFYEIELFPPFQAQAQTNKGFRDNSV